MKSDADIRSLLLLLLKQGGGVAGRRNPSCAVRRPISSMLSHVIRQVDTLP